MRDRAMGRVQAIGYQVNEILKQYNGTRQSKLKSRNESGLIAENGHKVSDKIHSYKSLDNARRDLTNLGKFAKHEYGVKEMKYIDKEIVREWLIQKDIVYQTASNYLSEINKVHKHLNITPKQVKEIRREIKQVKRTSQMKTRAYKKLDQVKMPEKSQPAFELQREHGLRIKAAREIIIDKQLHGNILKYREKGGKWAQKEISLTLASKIKKNAVNGKYEVKYETYRDQLKKAIEKTGQVYNGTHGIRHAYAQRELEAGKSKQEVSEAMGHKRPEITNTYLR